MLSAFEIATALAHALGGGVNRTGGQCLVRCPCHADRTASLAVRDSENGVLVFCHAGCPNAVVVDELKRRGLWPEHEHDRPVTPRQHVRRDDDEQRRTMRYAREIWAAATDPRDTLGERYLQTRPHPLSLDDELRGRVLRFHPRCPFGRDEAGNRLFVPALIAAFRPMRNDDEDEPPRAIHRIGLTADGRKLGKMMLGPVDGCAVKLDPDDMVEDGLGIAEGIETALAVYLDGWHPVWALGSAGRIAKLEPLPGVECLTIFADHDDTGLRDARECQQRWTDAGLEAPIKYRAESGKDFADA